MGEKALNQPAYIAWKSDCRDYLPKQEGKKLVNLIDGTLQDFCAEIICNLDQKTIYFIKMMSIWLFWATISILPRHTTTKLPWQGSTRSSRISAVQRYWIVALHFMAHWKSVLIFRNPECRGAAEEIFMTCFSWFYNASIFINEFRNSQSRNPTIFILRSK